MMTARSTPSLAFALVLVGCSVDAQRSGTPMVDASARSPLEQLCTALVARLDEHARTCGCPPSADERAQLYDGCATLYGVEAMAGAPEPLTNATALGTCLREIDAALDPSCRQLELPPACDLAEIARGGADSVLASRGEPCNYAVCEPGLVCRGDEERSCVDAPTPRASLCDSLIDLPAFAP